jgi:hypothetical protein
MRRKRPQERIPREPRKTARKRRVNLTLEKDVVEAGHRVARARNRSLSSIVEGILRRMVFNAAQGIVNEDGDQEEIHWLDRFHQKCRLTGFVAPTDEEIKQLRQGIAKKYA